MQVLQVVVVMVVTSFSKLTLPPRSELRRQGITQLLFSFSRSAVAVALVVLSTTRRQVVTCLCQRMLDPAVAVEAKVAM